jgi:putative Ca2+/H+ antiporter (TMEM165/GDT1 family)
MTAYLSSLGFVVLAEMGDKTQLLAVAFASRYRWQTVMWGVFAATLVNHLLAVAVGSCLTAIVPMEYIQMAAAGSFIFFGLWTLRGDKLEGEDTRFNYSPFWTVAIAFFIAEMGDKTQLATVALAARYESILSVWLGTTSGMVIADAVGIVVGIVLGRKIPERFIKWFAALVFIAFGIIGLWQVLSTTALLIVLGALALLLVTVREQRN